MANDLHPPKPPSLWEKEVYAQKADVIIIGAGITGLCTACSLLINKPGLQVKVIDNTIAPAGASTRNAGFVCFGSIGELLDDMQDRSEDEVWELVQNRWEGVQLLTSLIPPAKLHYEQKGGGEIFTDEESYQAACDYVPRANHFMQDITGFEDVFSVDDLHGHQGIRCSVEGMLHSGYLIELLENRATVMGASIRRGYHVTNVEPGIVTVDGIGELKAKNIVIAANGYSKTINTDIPVEPARGYVLVTTPQEQQPWEGTFHYDRGYVYFRDMSDNRMLIGGCRNLDIETERTTRHGINPKIKDGVKKLISESLLPQWDGGIEQEWTGIMGMGPNKLPIIEETEPGIVVAAGLSGMGVALGAKVGRKAADIILQS